MSRRSLVRSTLALALFALLGEGCGARTGLRRPDVPTDRNAGDFDVERPSEEVCVEVDPGAGLVTVNLETRPQLSVADIFLVVDRTGSMDGEIDNIKTNLQSRIIPAIARNIRDVQFGVATYADFPIDPYGDPMDIPFTLVSTVDRSVANIQGAVNAIRVGGGGDNAEALTEALFQVSSGEGFPPWIPARSPCPVPGRLGYGCLRPNAQSIFIVVNDAPTHNGPTSRNAYVSATFTNPARCPSSLPNCRSARGPHTYFEMIAALRAVRARVIGISSGVSPFSGREDLLSIARDTGTVTAAGIPLVFDIGSDGRDLDARVVTAVETFTQQVRFNASARVLDLDAANPATPLVRAVRPVSASPMGNVVSIDATTFNGVVPGTRLTFAIDLQASIPRGAAPRRIPARVQFLADGRANLGFRDIVLVIPSEAGEGCGATDDGGVSSDAGM